MQEEGRPEGIITLGTPPSPLPEVNSRYEVWIKDDDPRHPQYEWIDPKKAKKAAHGPRKGTWIKAALLSSLQHRKFPEQPVIVSRCLSFLVRRVREKRPETAR